MQTKENDDKSEKYCNQKQNTFIKRYGMGAIILFLKIQIIYKTAANLTSSFVVKNHRNKNTNIHFYR